MDDAATSEMPAERTAEAPEAEPPARICRALLLTKNCEAFLAEHKKQEAAKLARLSVMEKEATDWERSLAPHARRCFYCLMKKSRDGCENNS